MAPLFLWPDHDSMVGLFCVHPPPERSFSMVHISNLHDCHLLLNDPELCREVTSYLLYCCHESMEDDQDFNFSVLQESDLPMINDLGPPEETIQINIKEDGHVITIYRIIYPTEVIFIPAEISDKFSF